MQEHMLMVRFTCEEKSQAECFQKCVQMVVDTATVVRPEKPVSLVGDEEICGAVARAWTYPKNVGKEMDSDLVVAAAREVTYL